MGPPKLGNIFQPSLSTIARRRLRRGDRSSAMPMIHSGCGRMFRPQVSIGIAVALALLPTAALGFSSWSVTDLPRLASPASRLHCLTRSTTRIHGFGTNRPSNSQYSNGILGRSRAELPALYSLKFDIDLTLPDGDAKSGDDGEPASREVDGPTSLRSDVTNILRLVATQGLLIPLSLALARVFGVANYGLGAGFSVNPAAIIQGLQYCLPLFGLAGIMRVIEPYSPALQGVTKATERTVLFVMGKKRRLGFALAFSILLGLCAGVGEELLFRGVFQTLLSTKLGSSNSALCISGVVFGLLHVSSISPPTCT